MASPLTQSSARSGDVSPSADGDASVSMTMSMNLSQGRRSPGTSPPLSPTGGRRKKKKKAAKNKGDSALAALGGADARIAPAEQRARVWALVAALGVHTALLQFSASVVDHRRAAKEQGRAKEAAYYTYKYHPHWARYVSRYREEAHAVALVKNALKVYYRSFAFPRKILSMYNQIMFIKKRIAHSWRTRNGALLCCLLQLNRYEERVSTVNAPAPRSLVVTRDKMYFLNSPSPQRQDASGVNKTMATSRSANDKSGLADPTASLAFMDSFDVSATHAYAASSAALDASVATFSPGPATALRPQPTSPRLFEGKQTSALVSCHHPVHRPLNERVLFQFKLQAVREKRREIRARHGAAVTQHWAAQRRGVTDSVGTFGDAAYPSWSPSFGSMCFSEVTREPLPWCPLLLLPHEQEEVYQNALAKQQVVINDLYAAVQLRHHRSLRNQPPVYLHNLFLREWAGMVRDSLAREEAFLHDMAALKLFDVDSWPDHCLPPNLAKCPPHPKPLLNAYQDQMQLRSMAPYSVVYTTLEKPDSWDGGAATRGGRSRLARRVSSGACSADGGGSSLGSSLRNGTAVQEKGKGRGAGRGKGNAAKASPSPRRGKAKSTRGGARGQVKGKPSPAGKQRHRQKQKSRSPRGKKRGGSPRSQPSS